jgi:hypothetical protein
VEKELEKRKGALDNNNKENAPSPASDCKKEEKTNRE